MQRALAALGEKLTPRLWDAYTAAIRGAKTLKVAKADDEDDKPKPGLQPDGSIVSQMGVVITAAEVQHILAEIEEQDFAALEGVLTPDVVAAFKQAGYSVVQEVHALSAEPHDILDTLDTDAVEYAEERGADLVTQLLDSTRDKVRGTLVDALTEGWSKDEFAAELQANYAFSPQRAEMIAHTELAFAHSYGRVEPMKSAGATKKKWLLSADHDPDEDCLCSDAADAGWIDIDDNFADDDDYDYPPGHPNCWCDWVSNLNGGDDDEEEDDDDTNGGGGSDDEGTAKRDTGDLRRTFGNIAASADDDSLRKQVRDIHARLARLRQRRDPDGIEDENEGLQTGVAGNVEGAALRARLEELAAHCESQQAAEKAAAALNDDEQVTKYPVDEFAHDSAMSPTNPDGPPSDPQRRAGNYRMGHFTVGGLPITIENPAGTPRKVGWTPIKGHYGYIRRTTGADGDHVDVFVKPGTDHEWTGPVYVVDQFRLNGEFDEHKCLIGYTSKEEAVDAYLGSYQPGWKLGPVNVMPWTLFVRWLKDGDTSLPISTNLEFFRPESFGKSIPLVYGANRVTLTLIDYIDFTKGDTAGHEFHGNQYTGGIGGGPKPTSAKTKGAKGGVHELLSSGHSFTMGELVSATGASESNIKTALSDLKSDKYAGKYGKLNITKNPDGSYSVKGGSTNTETTGTGQITGAGKPEDTGTKPVATPTEGGAKEEAAAATKESFESMGLIAPSSDKAHDVIYAAKLNVALSHLATTGDVQMFKDEKAAAMANWSNAAHGGGVTSTAAPQKVFEADKLLATNLKSGMGYKQAYDQWKQDTAAEKVGTLGTKSAISAAPAAQAPKLEGVGKPSGESTRGIPTDTAASHTPIGEEEFTAKNGEQSQFAKGLSDVHQALQNGSKDAVGNKMSVEAQLKEELKNSPNFQALKAEAEKDGGSSLESRLVSQWASSSGDHNTMSVAMQMAAKEVFGMKDDDISTKALGSLHSVGSEEALMKTARDYLSGYNKSTTLNVATTREGLKEFVAGMYRATQADLASRGIKSLYVARGMHLSSDDVAVRKVALQPMSSFSTNLPTAYGFGSGGSTFITRIPASQVIGTFRSGFGCSSEHEVVVLAHAGMKAVKAPTSKLVTLTDYYEGHEKTAATVSAYIQAQLEEKRKFKGMPK